MSLRDNTHTKITALNTFSQGLVMDFAPENTTNEILTNALNATFLTFNGNEGMLQNDMGNARVNTAYLPTGYVPVGTCEFGDIIYIVSYNPIENKSLIGCFPSPERNISNKEISTLVQSVSKDEFIEYNTKIVKNQVMLDSSAGIVKASTARKIVYGNSNINPGDKFLISWGEEGITNKNYISNFGNTSKNINTVEAYWPKLMQVHVVSIEDSGKVTKLDSTVKWYTNGSDSENVFIVSDEDLNNDSNVATVDSYRNALQCLYSVFQSKTSGKLALFFELETINNFSCGHKIFQKTIQDTNGKNITAYDIYLSASWETDNYNINPCGMIITDSVFYHMDTVDSKDTILKLDSLKNNKISEEEQKKAIYSASRVIEFTRTYKVELYIDSFSTKTYELFLKSDSFYALIENYKYIKIPFGKDVDTTELDSSKIDSSTSEYTIQASRAVRVYTYNKQGGKYPKTFSTMSSTDVGVYVLNPDRSTKIESQEQLDNINNAYPSANLTLNVGDYFYQTRIDAYWGACKEIAIPDDIIVNYFKRSVLKKLTTVKRTEFKPTDPDEVDTLQIAEGRKREDLLEYKIKYTVCPCMPYGVLDSLAVTNTIDFNEVQDGSVELITWQYYVNATSLVLKFGFDTHLREEENEVVEKVVMQFYDTTGVCASYELTGLDSYDATFTEYIELDKIPSNSRFSSKSLVGREVSNQIYRRSPEKYTYKDITESNKYSYFITLPNGVTKLCAELTDKEKGKLSDTWVIYKLTSGILYYGRPYGVRIYIFKGTLTELGEIDTSGNEAPIIYDRWLWTAPVFNNNYNSTPDFKNCELRVGLDFLATLDSRKMATKLGAFVVSPVLDLTVEAKSTFRARVDYIKEGTIVCKGTPILMDNFGKSLFLNNDSLPYILIYITTNNDNTITVDSEEYVTEYEEAYISELSDLYPKIDSEKQYSTVFTLYPKKILDAINSQKTGTIVDNTVLDSTENLIDSFELNLKEDKKNTTDFSYLDDSNEIKTLLQQKCIKIAADSWIKDGIQLTLSGVKFTKIQAAQTNKQLATDIYARALETTLDLDNYGLAIATSNSVFYHPYLPFLGLNEKGGKCGEIGIGSIAFDSTGKMSAVQSYNTWEDGDSATINFADADTVNQYRSLLGSFITPLLFLTPDISERGNKDGMLIDGANLNNLHGREGDLESKFSTGNYVVISSKGIVEGSNKNVGVCLSFVDLESNTGCIGPDFRLYYTKSLDLYLQFWLSNYLNGASNYADLIGALLYNIFIKVDGERIYYTPSNIANIKKYKELWKKDIVVKQIFSDIYSDPTVFCENKSSSTFITILPGYSNNGVTGVNLFAYVRWILCYMYGPYQNLNDWISTVGSGDTPFTPESMSYSERDDIPASECLTFKNINPIIQDSTKCISFLYSVPYTPNAVKSALLLDDTKTGFVRIYNAEGEAEYTLVVPVNDETAVCIFDGESIRALRSVNSSLKLLTKATAKNGYIYGTMGKKSIPLNNSGLFSCLKNNGGSIIIKNLSTLKNYYSKYLITFVGSSTNDSNYIQGLAKTYLFTGSNAW